jgi:hypothetical protein
MHISRAPETNTNTNAILTHSKTTAPPTINFTTKQANNVTSSKTLSANSQPYPTSKPNT